METPRTPMLPINRSPTIRRTGFDAFTPAPVAQPLSLPSDRAPPPTKPMSSAASGPRRSRIRHLALVIILVSGTLMLFSGPSLSNKSSQKDSLFFCPHSTSKRHTPTVILQADGANARTENRTYWVGGSDLTEFLPLASQPHDLRFLQSTGLGASQLHHPHLQDHTDKPEQGRQLCHVHRVPSSPRAAIPSTWKDSKIMFGMSTTPDRALYSLPVWSHWVPASKERIDLSGHSPAAAALVVPEILILTHPSNPTEASRITEAVEEAHGLGINVVMRKQDADRFETRYFMLAKEMWTEAQRKEKAHGVETDWFVFCDDDTFFPDWNSVVRMLLEHDPAKPILIGALSESVHQVKKWGHISYGGAGIFVSRAMLHLINGPGQIENCLDKFGSAFGGDAMIAHCAALVTKRDIKDVLTLDDTLHQLDIRGDGTGFFQSGFLITSLHHWGGWFTIFPPWSESGSGDLRKSISLVGRAAKAVGGDNWGRRYVFEDGKVVVSLGYSISIEARALSESELNRSEHTWWEFETFHPIRPGKHESIEKRTYYLSAVRHLESGVVKLEHKNRENERADVIWDAREG